MTASSTLLALFLMPLCLWIYSRHWINTAVVQLLPLGAVSLTLGSTLLPIGLGLLIRYRHPRAADIMVKVGPARGVPGRHRGRGAHGREPPVPPNRCESHTGIGNYLGGIQRLTVLKSNGGTEKAREGAGYPYGSVRASRILQQMHSMTSCFLTVLLHPGQAKPTCRHGHTSLKHPTKLAYLRREE